MGLILDLSHEDLSRYLKGLGEQGYRADQVWEWIFKRKTLSFEEMTNLPINLRKTLSAEFLQFPELIRVSISRDNTVKYLWRMKDGELVESVLLHYLTSHRNWVSVCVSTQAGCPIKCSFCQTGLSGFRRNLTQGEILAQIIGMEIESGVSVSRVLFMGMGEPLLNFKETLGAIEVLMQKESYGLSGRRITLSTAGPEELERFLQEGARVEVAYSLHTPDDELRKSLIKYPRLLPVEKALSLLLKYQSEYQRRVSVEYLLLKGINDTEDHARSLVKLLRGKPFFVNLLPFNSCPGSKFSASSPELMREFKQTLIRAGIKAAIRKPKGLEIQAACGQLRLKTLDEHNIPVYN